jgi:hypothetical protein
MLAMSGNVPTLFLNHAENEWMLDWAQQASSQLYSPDNGGPLVWYVYNTIYTILHYTTLHYTTLHYTTLHCTTLHYSLYAITNMNG